MISASGMIGVLVRRSPSGRVRSRAYSVVAAPSSSEVNPAGAYGPTQICSSTPMPVRPSPSLARTTCCTCRFSKTQRIELGGVEALAGRDQLALPHALTPLRVAVAQPLHLELQHRVERDGAHAAVESDEIDLGSRRQPRAGVVGDPMRRGGHAGLDALRRVGHVGLGGEQRRLEPLAHQRLTLVAVEEDGVRHVVVPHERRPQEERAAGMAGRRRGARCRLAHTPDAPRPVLRAPPRLLVDLELAVGGLDGAGPATELVEAGRVHRSTRAVPQDLSVLLDRRGPGREREVAGQTGVVVLEHDPGAPQRFDDLQPERPDRHVGALERRPTRTEEGVLASAGRHRTEGAVHDPAGRVDGHPDAEVRRAVEGVAVEPRPVVDVAIRRRRMGDRLGCLVDGEVVESVQHGVIIAAGTRRAHRDGPRPR